MIGSLIIAAITAFIGAVFGSVALPVLGVMAVAVVGYVIAATVVSKIDREFDIKNNLTKMVK